jgi:hypothetical protein
MVILIDITIGLAPFDLNAAMAVIIDCDIIISLVGLVVWLIVKSCECGDGDGHINGLARYCLVNLNELL